MKADWELLAEEPDEPAQDELPPWWRVHVGTFLGAIVMAAGTAIAASGAVAAGGWTWLAPVGFGINAVCLAAIARIRILVRIVEGERKYARISELGPWARREWWLTLLAFFAFTAGLAATALA